jgi:hypothetical protein
VWTTRVNPGRYGSLGGPVDDARYISPFRYQLNDDPHLEASRDTPDTPRFVQKQVDVGCGHEAPLLAVE